MAKQVSAEVIGQAAMFDKQIFVPRYPVIRQGVSVEPYGEAALVLGGAKPQLLSGSFSTTYLHDLLSCCDGVHDLKAISEKLDVSENIVFKAVAFLWSCGVLEDESCRIANVSKMAVPEPLSVRLSRLGDSTGNHAHWTQGVKRLRDVKLRIIGEDCDKEYLEDLLAKTGICISENTSIADSDLVVFVDSKLLFESNAIVEECWEENVPLLYVGAAAEKLVIGPYVNSSYTPCFECAKSVYDFPREVNASCEKNRELTFGLIVHQIFALLTRAIPSHLPNDICVTDLKTLEKRYLSPATRAGCDVCGAAQGVVVSRPSLSAMYEQSVASPPRIFLDAKGHQAHYQSSNLALQKEFRAYPSCPALELSVPSLKNWGSSLTLEQISTILNYSVGLRPEKTEGRKVRRWTAAGGNIGSVIVHVVIRDSSIAPVGTYVYLENTHQLAYLSEATPGPQGDVVIVFSGNVIKVSQKYGSFALRICIQDAGCSSLVARRVANEIGCTVQMVPFWDDDAFSDVFGLPTDFYPITAVLVLGETNAN